MSPVVLQSIGAAVGALVLALLGYLTASVQAHTRELAAQQAAAIAKEQAAAARGRRATDAGGGATPTRAAPLWNQLNDPLSQGGLPLQRYNECGEECCAEVIWAQHGVEISADALRSQLRGPAGSALTTATDLVRILARNNVQATAVDDAADVVAAALQLATSEGRMAIALGRWVSPTILHWVLVTRADAAGCGYNDPWGGLRHAVDWTAFRARYAGTLVLIQRTPDAP